MMRTVRPKHLPICFEGHYIHNISMRHYVTNLRRSSPPLLSVRIETGFTAVDQRTAMVPTYHEFYVLQSKGIHNESKMNVNETF